MIDQKLKKSVVSVIERDIDQEKIFGAAVRISIQNKMILNENINVKRDGLFYLASMTKPVTAVAVLVQTQRGKLRLDDPVAKYLPAYANMYIGRLDGDSVVPDRKAGAVISIRHLLTHTSGIISNPIGESYFSKLRRHRTSLENAVDYYPQTLLAFEPGSRQGYSPTAAFDVAARILEMVSDMPFNEYLNQTIFAPLGIRNMGYFPLSERQKHLVPMHSRDESGHSLVAETKDGIRDLPDTYYCAGGGLASTADDYARFADMLCQEGKGLLSSENCLLMRTEQQHGWGFGVRVVRNDPYLPDGCFGWSGALGTHFWVDPTHKLYALYMKNSMYDGGAGATTARTFEKAVMERLT